MELHPGFAIDASDIVIDIGSGYGDTICKASLAAKRVIAVDVADALLAIVTDKLKNKAKCPFETKLYSGELPLPIADSTATVVICTEVLEHVRDPLATVRDLVRIGKVGCRYVISAPDSRSEFFLKQVAPSWAWEAPHHINIFSQDDFRVLLETGGLVIERSSRRGAFWTVFWLLAWASGTSPASRKGSNKAAILKGWEDLWKRLRQTPEGLKQISELEKSIPKSQIVYARKP